MDVELATYGALEPQIRDPNVTFDNNFGIVSRSEYCCHYVIAHRKIRTIETGKKLYIYYNSSYDFMNILNNTFFLK